MGQIVVNLLLIALWAALTAALTVGVSVLGERNPQMGGLSAFGIWLVGQLIILLPLIRVLWRDRRMDFERS